MASQVDQNTWRSYALALNSFLIYLQLEVRLKPPRRIRKEAEHLSKGEFVRMLDASENQMARSLAKRDRAILFLLGEGAARAGEVRNLRIKDLDLEKGVAIARRPKGKHDRKIFFGEATSIALAEYLKARGHADDPLDEEFLFLNVWGRRITGSNTILHLVYRLAKRAGIERKVHPHMFRHMRITELSKQGLNPFQLQRFAGHADIGTTMAYVHVDEEEVMEAVRARPAMAAVGGQRNCEREELMISLAKRLALGQISGETYIKAIHSLD